MVLELGLKSQKRPKIQVFGLEISVLGPRICPRFRFYLLDVCPRSQKMTQIYVLMPGSGPTIRTYVLEKALDLGLRSQIQVLGPRKCHRFRFQVLGLGPRSQKGPSFRSNFLEKDVDLGPKFQKMSKIYVLCPRFISQVPENVLELYPRSQIQVLGPRKYPRFRS